MIGDAAVRKHNDSGHQGTAMRLGDLLAEQASRTFAGRKNELALLLEMLGNSGPAIIYLHGIAGLENRGWSQPLLNARALKMPLSLSLTAMPLSLRRMASCALLPGAWAAILPRSKT